MNIILFQSGSDKLAMGLTKEQYDMNRLCQTQNNEDTQESSGEESSAEFVDPQNMHNMFSDARVLQQLQLHTSPIASADGSNYQMVANGKKYQCTICSKTYPRKYLFQEHNWHHTGVKPYKCDECGVSFVKNRTLTDHKRRHTRDNPSSCPTCRKTLPDSLGLTCHMRTHAELGCEMCGKGFATANALSKHMRSQHKVL